MNSRQHMRDLGLVLNKRTFAGFRKAHDVLARTPLPEDDQPAVEAIVWIKRLEALAGSEIDRGAVVVCLLKDPPK